MSPRERLFALEQFGIKLGLDNIATLCRALGHPERAFPSIHVAGTNGKGSVTAMVERGLRAAGHTTGRYTSPHLACIEERVALDGQSIDAVTFDAVTEHILATIDQLHRDGALTHPPTFFEATTAVAFEVFRRRRVTVAVIEVGLGGRFDATNILMPDVTAITSIAFDHERHLGRSLGHIAFEKAGVIKTDVPVVVGAVPAEALDVIARVAHEVGAPLLLCPPAPKGATALTLALAGRHQHANAAVAAEVMRQCGKRGLGITRDHIMVGLTDVDWPARLEWLRLPSGEEVLFDAAHNPAGAQALAEYVAETTGPLPVVLGVMADKDVEAMVGALSPAMARVVATQAPTPRALSAAVLADRLRHLLPAMPVDDDEDPEVALAAALAQSPRAIVAGSIFLVGPLRERLLARGAKPVRYPSNAPPFLLS